MQVSLQTEKRKKYLEKNLSWVLKENFFFSWGEKPFLLNFPNFLFLRLFFSTYVFLATFFYIARKTVFHFKSQNKSKNLSAAKIKNWKFFKFTGNSPTTPPRFQKIKKGWNVVLWLSKSGCCGWKLPLLKKSKLIYKSQQRLGGVLGTWVCIKNHRKSIVSF